MKTLSSWSASWSALLVSMGERNPYGLAYAAARTLLALGTLLTLWFNSDFVLFADPKIMHPRSYVEACNVYYLVCNGSFLWYRVITSAVLLAVISGYFPRLTGILHWWVAHTFFYIVTNVDGGDQINTILCFALVPLTLLDGRKNHWSLQPVRDTAHFYRNTVANGLMLLIRVQMSYVYLQAATEKLKVKEWVDGTVLYYWFTHSIIGAPAWLMPLLRPLLVHSLPVLLLTWSVLLLEGALFAALFVSKKNQRRLLVAGLVFHFGIVLVHGLVSFFFAMSAGLILYLLPARQRTTSQVQALGTRLRAYLAGRPAPAARPEPVRVPELARVA